MNPAALSAALSGDVANALAASTPGGIERQEAAGQASMIASHQLPREVTNATREQMEALGFVFGADVDELFVGCLLPAGWTKKATNHAMHSELLDDKGRVRAQIFYKAAFYDRRADMHFKPRYWVSAYQAGPSENEFRVCAMSGATEIHQIGEFSREMALYFKEANRLEALAKDWLTEKFPNWQDTFAYWD